MKIKIKLFNNICFPKVRYAKGDWIDLCTAETVSFTGPKVGRLTHKRDDKDNKFRNIKWNYKLIPLGVAMELPEGFEAVIVARSSTFKNYNIMQTNAMAVIDNSYKGDNDQWHFPALAFKDITINEGTYICQFRIQLSQFATWKQKLRWLFTRYIDLRIVDSLESKDRGGFGSTDVE